MHMSSNSNSVVVQTIRFVAIFLVMTSASLAAPTVDGNTISWPDDGWYQVQNSSTYAEVCSGGSQCSVSDGSYTVINHDTGMRWESIEVDTSSSSRPSVVVVEGDTISWPNDGWYQVQLISTQQTICQGGLSCVVEPGVYNVINHTSGTRHEQITVNAAEASLDPNVEFNSRTSSWSVNDHVIEFKTEGWFQVQKEGRPFTYPTVCEGQNTCTVETGYYQIVNHNTREVWQHVNVGNHDLFWTQTKINEASIGWYIVRNFLRGTNYRLSVFAVLADGSEELIGKRDVLTTGPSMESIAFGRPVDDLDTFGFYIWDSFDESSLSSFPSDCMFAIPDGGFCYSPSSRFLMGYFNSFSTATAPIDWEYELPGSNDTNNIEALVHFYGSGGRRGAVKLFSLVTDITKTFGQSEYEISVFNGFGTFIGTFPILEKVRFSNVNGIERQINLDGADLTVTIGPVRPHPSPFVTSYPRRLHISGEYYEPNNTNPTSELSGWSKAGAFFAIIDSETGETLSSEYYPGVSVVDIPDATLP